MSANLCLVLVFTLATKVLAFPFLKANIAADKPYTIDKKIPEEVILVAQSLSGNIVHFVEDHALVDLDILDLSKLLGLTTLVDLVAEAGLTKELFEKGLVTVFGPTNEAFNNAPAWVKCYFTNNTMLANLLLYHALLIDFPYNYFADELLMNTALNGKKLRVNMYSNNESISAAVVTAQCAPVDLSRVDNKATNGLIHVLNSIMLPPMGCIFRCLEACPVFTTLISAIKAADLSVELGRDEPPVTLFAPTDKAFQKLSPSILHWLMTNVTALRNVLEYHIVPLTYCSAALSAGIYSQLTTLSKQNITIQVSPGSIKVNDANVIVSDGSVTNGVIHAIDTVLIPLDMKMAYK